MSGRGLPMRTDHLPADLTKMTGMQVLAVLEVYDQPHKRATELISMAVSYCQGAGVSPKRLAEFVDRVTITLMSIGIERGWEQGRAEAERR